MRNLLILPGLLLLWLSACGGTTEGPPRTEVSSPSDTDDDGIPDSEDLCPGGDDSADADNDTVPDDCDACVGDDATGDTDTDGVCDDTDACTGDDATGDTDTDGVCNDTDPCPLDSPDDTDADGVCDSDDACPGSDDLADTDADTVPDGCDVCTGDDATGDTDTDGVCNDTDPCPLDSPDDTDADGVCDSDDACPGSDDLADADADTVPDGCDVCTGNDATGDTDTDGVCDDTDPCPLDSPDDTDADGVCDSDDACPGSDDLADADADTVPDGCDVCTGDDAAADSDTDGVCDDIDLCAGDDASGDTDTDGACDDTDPCPLDNPDDSDLDGVCDHDDLCPGGDDTLDADTDEIPDFCDLCTGDDTTGDADNDGVCDDIDLCVGDDVSGDTDTDGACDDIDPCPLDNPDDSDSDTVCDADDLCPGGDDTLDVDLDAIPDACDLCTGDNGTGDADNDGVCGDLDLCLGDDATGDDDGDSVCNDSDLCLGDNATGDTDADGVCDDTDLCPLDNPDDTDGDGVCDADEIPPTPALTPSAPMHGDDTFGCADADGRLDITALLALNGEPVAIDTPLADAVVPGDVLSCTVTADDGSAPGQIQATVTGGNILLLISDDQGAEYVSAYGENLRVQRTPVMDQLASEGVLFRRAYANPYCSPTRAAILTGQHAFRTGLTKPIRQDPEDLFELDDAIMTIPRLLDEALPGVYAHSAIGKWHLSHLDIIPTGRDHALRVGFDSHIGTLTAIYDYFDWWRWDNGSISNQTDYAGSVVVDDAVSAAQELPQPWFIWVGFHEAHVPYHEPPAHLHTTPLSVPPTDDELLDAMVEALDTEMGRLIGSITPEMRQNTTIIFMGDNGSNVTMLHTPDPLGGKGTLRETGVRIPLIISGPSVATPGIEAQGLVSAVDILATVADLAGAPLTPAQAAAQDGVSIAPILVDPDASIQETVYQDYGKPIGFGPYTTYKQAIQNQDFKLYRDLDGESFYDMRGVLIEGDDLLTQLPLDPDAQAAYDALSQELDTLYIPAAVP